VADRDRRAEDLARLRVERRQGARGPERELHNAGLNGRIVKVVAPSDFRLLVENAPDGIVVSRDGIVLYANRAAARLLGHDDVSELVGKPMTFLDRKSAEVMRQRVQRMAETGERLVPREYLARRRDGSEMTAEIASAIIDYEGHPAVLAYCRDVTDRTRLRAQLAHSDRLAALGTMAAGVAHEINNPLAFMGLAAESLARRVGQDEGALVKEIRAGVDRIAAIVRDLRSFGRNDEVAPGPLNLATAIDAAERLVQHEVRPRGTLIKELGQLPLVLGAPRRIEQVFVNLFLNAAHALGDRLDGRIMVRADVTADRVVVSVEDDGAGIPEEYLDSIFEPFFTTRSNAGGTGLGLSICRDIVVRAGGDLVARSTVGQGTTMTVTLLRAIGDRAEVRPSTPPSVPPAAALAVGPKRVLIVDDETAIVRLLSESLQAMATVVGETVPGRALALILGEPAFDAIVCDVMMPGMTGIDLHERVARDRPDLAARFVFMCGGTYTARARDHLERVPNPRLNKPFRMAQLIDAIERVAGGAAG
jgi:PAS domain S-box-containing protein